MLLYGTSPILLLVGRRITQKVVTAPFRRSEGFPRTGYCVPACVWPGSFFFPGQDDRPRTIYLPLSDGHFLANARLGPVRLRGGPGVGQISGVVHVSRASFGVFAGR